MITMSNAATTETETPVFNIQKLYVKDISFENPNAPEVFTVQNAEPNVELNIGLENRQLDAEHWEVTLKVSVMMRDDKNDKLLFEIEIEHAGLFYIKNVPEEHMVHLLGVDCPTILFPYTRQIISQLTVDGGFMSLMLEPVNFSAAFESSRAQQQEQQKQKETIN